MATLKVKSLREQRKGKWNFEIQPSPFNHSAAIRIYLEGEDKDKEITLFQAANINVGINNIDKLNEIFPGITDANVYGEMFDTAEAHYHSWNVEYDWEKIKKYIEKEYEIKRRKEIKQMIEKETIRHAEAMCYIKQLAKIKGNEDIVEYGAYNILSMSDEYELKALQSVIYMLKNNIPQIKVEFAYGTSKLFEKFFGEKIILKHRKKMSTYCLKNPYYA